MAVLSYFLVFLALCSLFGSSFASERCTELTFGEKTDYTVHMTRAYFAPGTKYQDIILHSGCDTKGVKVIACDDVAPNVYVRSMSEVFIDRLGSLDYPGYADTVAYCTYFHAPHVVSPKPQLHESFIGSDEASKVIT